MREEMVEILVKNTKYNGKYVALKSFESHEIVGCGTTPEEAYEKAQQNGYESPVISFVPTKEMIQIY